MLKVLFVSRPTLFSGPGGDTIQLLKTKQYLENIGVEIDIFDGKDVDIKEYDLVHFFNLRNPQDILHLVRKTKNLINPWRCQLYGELTMNVIKRQGLGCSVGSLILSLKVLLNI